MILNDLTSNHSLQLQETMCDSTSMASSGASLSNVIVVLCLVMCYILTYIHINLSCDHYHDHCVIGLVSELASVWLQNMINPLKDKLIYYYSRYNKILFCDLSCLFMLQRHAYNIYSYIVLAFQVLSKGQATLEHTIYLLSCWVVQLLGSRTV